MLTLYTSATGEGWPRLVLASDSVNTDVVTQFVLILINVGFSFILSAMHHTMDVTAVDQGPVRNYSVENALFYIAFVVVFSFFFLNIFVALVILTFQEQGEKELVNSELDRNQVKLN